MRTLNGITYLSSHVFDEGVAHGFLTRKGGVSAPPYESLNFGEREADKREHVDENRKRVLAAFGAGSLFTINQVHGASVFRLGPDAPLAPPDADAIITAEEGAAIGILTADCLPVLLFDPVNRAVSAVHAGWRGTALGVTLNAVREMGKAFGTKPRDLKAAIGPSIGPCCYSVGENVYEEFRAEGRSLDSFISLDDGLRLDLGAENISQLLSLGVGQRNISGSAPCTSCSGDFFSYRRDQGRTGRQLSFIMLVARGGAAGR
ncbi:MAG: peptidoglycan editing factor PgeF [Thermodesulfobacteriota bacterium]|nr:MAG: peptidoglycan editing factor PgeF [Thermodesulfobacteriota bacterium]